MEYRNLGKSGLKVSALSFGTWVTFSNQIDVGLAVRCMGIAYDRGVNFFDNAEVYAAGQSEVIMGEALRKLGWKRDTYCVSSKVFWGGDAPTQRGLSAKHVYDACHAAMKRLQVDYLDLYFCHRPDPETPILETARAMNHLILQGKVLYWGTSEWTAEQLSEAFSLCEQNHLIPPTMEQPEYNMFQRQKVESDYLPLYDKGLGTTIWSPLASGILTGKYNDGVPAGSRMDLPNFAWLREQLESPDGQKKLQITRKLSALAKELGVSMTLLAIAWCLRNPHVSTVILGASRPEQLEENFKALEVQSLFDPSVVSRIDTILADS